MVPIFLLKLGAGDQLLEHEMLVAAKIGWQRDKSQHRSSWTALEQEQEDHEILQTSASSVKTETETETQPILKNINVIPELDGPTETDVSDQVRVSVQRKKLIKLF